MLARRYAVHLFRMWAHPKYNSCTECHIIILNNSEKILDLLHDLTNNKTCNSSEGFFKCTQYIFLATSTDGIKNVSTSKVPATPKENAPSSEGLLPLTPSSFECLVSLTFPLIFTGLKLDTFLCTSSVNQRNNTDVLLTWVG